MTSSVPTISDCSYWIYEMARYLFLAKIYMSENREKPRIDGDPLNYIESIINLSTLNEENTGSAQRCLLMRSDEESLSIPINENIKCDLSDINTSELRGTLELIKNNSWDELNMSMIESSEDILYKILKEIKKYE